MANTFFNIDDFSSRVQREYVHFSADNAEMGSGVEWFNQRSMEAQSQALLQSSQAQELQTQMKQNAPKAREAFSVLNDLVGGTLVEDIYEAMVADLNKGIESTIGSSSFGQIYSQAYSYSSLLADTQTNREQVSDFLQLIIQATEEMGRVDQDLFDELTALNTRLGGAKALTTSKKIAKVVTKEQVERSNNIIQYLKNAVDNFGSGPVSPASFRSTIKNIFALQFGENIGKDITNKAYAAAEELEESAVAALSKSLPDNVKLIWNKNARSTLSGTRKDKSGTTIKADILRNKALTIEITGTTGEVYDFNLSSNISIKWGKSDSSILKSIKVVGGSPVSKYIGKTSYDRYYAYNILAHRFTDGGLEAWRSLRASWAASFLTQWMRGSGEAVQGSRLLSDAQFFLINGKLYTMNSIVSAIAKDLATKSYTTESANMPFNITVSGTVNNSWIADGGLRAAVQRSEIAKSSINSMKVNATINLGNIAQYLT